MVSQVFLKKSDNYEVRRRVTDEQLDQLWEEVVLGGGGGPGTGIGISGEVNTWADLPTASTHTGEYYTVLTTTGIIGFRKFAGIWRSDGSAWVYLGNPIAAASDIANIPAGTVSATDVQSAVNELDGDIQGHIATGGFSHAAVTTGTNGFMIAADKVKLDGIASGATVNSADAFLLSRANHTGTQASSTITNFNTDVDARVTIAMNAHTAAADPHPGYLSQAEGDSLYQPLNANLTTFAGTSSTAYGRGLLNLADTAALTAAVDNFTSALPGLAPASGGGTTNYLRADGSWAAPSGGGGSSVDSRMPVWVTDFTLTGASQSDFNMGAISSGTFNTSTAGDANHLGVVLWRSSTTANSGVQCTALTNSILIAGGEQWDVNFRTMAAFTNTTFRSGLLDVQAATAVADGAYLQFNGSGTLSGACRTNSVETATASTYALAVSTWYHGRITVNSNATSVLFELYNDSGTLLWSDTVTTNIPTAAGRETGAGTIATNSGTAATDLVRMDRMKFTIPGRTVARGAA